MRRQRGFTLLEVIVAFALLALALTLLLGSLSGATRQIAHADLRGTAMLHAQSLLAEAGTVAPLQEGASDGTWEQGRYQWQLQVDPFDDGRDRVARTVGAPRLLQLTLEVRWGDREGDRLRLRSLRLVPAGMEGGE